jgi:hypothetical protein
MKHIIISISAFLLLAVPKPVYSQEFWEVVDMPGVNTIYDIEITSSQRLMISVKGDDGLGCIISGTYPDYNWDTVLYQGSLIEEILIDKYNNIYGVGDYTLFYSFDGGENWDSNTVDLMQMGTPSMYKLGSGKLLIGTWGGIILCDTIGTDYSFVETSPLSEVFNDFQYNFDSTILYAGSTCFSDNSGGIYCSYDDGLSWENAALYGSYISSLSMNNDGDIFAGSQGHFTQGIGGVYRLLFGEDEWEHINADEIVSSIDIGTNNDIYIGCTLMGWPGGVRVSYDNGFSWDIINDGFNAPDIVGLFLSEYIYAIESGPPHTFYKSTEPVVSSIDKEICFNSSLMVKACPTPFNNQLSIFIDASLKSTYLSILNCNGEIIYNGYINQTINIDTSNLPSGIYYCIIQSFNSLILKKLIKCK